MNPLEEQLKQFANNEVLFNAVRGQLLSQCDLNSLSVNLPDTEIYEKAGSFLRAREIITLSFKGMAKYRTKEKTESSEGNPNNV